MLPLRLDRRRHIIIEEHPIAQAAHDILDEDTLVYYHRQNGVFVLAVWLNRSAGLIRELPLQFRSPSQVTREQLAAIAYIGTQAHRKAIIAIGKDDARKTINIAKDDNERERERQSYIKYMCRNMTQIRKERFMESNQNLLVPMPIGR